VDRWMVTVVSQPTRCHADDGYYVGVLGYHVLRPRAVP